MARHVDPERLYIASRMGLSARLVADAKMTPESAERWIGVWEAEARSRHLDARKPEWWDPAWDWIAGQWGGASKPPLAHERRLTRGVRGVTVR
jgi:hypothetical protein